MDNLLIGRWWKTADVGQYDLGVRVGTFPSTITTAASSIIYPLFCRLQGDRSRLQHAYLKVVELISFVTFPIGVGISASAPLVIPWAFGSQWAPAVAVLQAVSIYGVLASVGGVMAPLCNALGRPRTLFWYLAFAAATAVPAYLIAVPYGIGAVAVAHLILVCLRFPLDVMIPSRLLGFSPRDFWRSVRTPALGSLTMGAGVVAMTVTFPRWFGLGDGVSVALTIPLAIAVYVYLVRTQGLVTLAAVRRLVQYPGEQPSISLRVS
jgi:O-antigen/teichoic acid export membrane protein